MGGVFTRDERVVLLFLVVAVTVGSLVLATGRVELAGSEGAAPDTARTPVEEAPLLVNVNEAGGEELERLPGIGPSKAEKILKLRRERGAFRSVDELDDVRGIGPVTLERLRPFVTLGGTPAPNVTSTADASDPTAESRGGTPAPNVTSTADASDPTAESRADTSGTKSSARAR